MDPSSLPGGETITDDVAAVSRAWYFSWTTMRCRALMTIVVGVALCGACVESGRPVSGGQWIGTPIADRPLPQPTPPVEVSSADEAGDDPPEEPVAELPRPIPMNLGPSGLPTVPGDAEDGGPEVRALLEQARALAAAGKLDDAIATLRRAATRAPRDPAVALAEGQIYQRAGRYSDAAVAFRRVRNRAPDDPDALYGEAFALLKLGRAAQAGPLVEALARQRPNDVQIERMRAAVLAGSGDVDGMLAARARIADKEEGAGARRELGDALARAGKHAAAAAAFGQAAAADPADARLRLRQGTALGLAGDLAGAERALETSARLAPGDPAAWRALAQVRQKRGDLAGAEKALATMLEKSGGTPADEARLERLRTARAAEVQRAAEAQRADADRASAGEE